MTKRVRVGQKFYFVPVLIDRIDAPCAVDVGDYVKVVNLHGAPKANTMGHCYVNVLMTANGVCTPGQFGGLVCTNSLVSRDEYMEYLKQRVAKLEDDKCIPC